MKVLKKYLNSNLKQKSEFVVIIPHSDNRKINNRQENFFLEKLFKE